MMNNVDKDCYAVFKSYYQLCKEEKREADIKMHYSTHQLKDDESLQLNDKIIHLNSQSASKSKKTVKDNKAKMFITKAMKAELSNQVSSLH